MSKITSLFQKTILLSLVAALALAALPVTNVSAQGLGQTPQPPVGQTQASNERLERAWARIQEVYERQGKIMNRAGEMTARIQSLIDKMNANGKDTTALQAALDAFEHALEEGKPLYVELEAIVTAHSGFDSQGKVTDREQAIATIKDATGKLKDLRKIVSEPGEALRRAIKAFREANRPTDGAGVPPNTDDRRNE
ncbi:MAG: hypothetical protein Fur0043_16120 [Anaerolineales bacterium]